MTEAERAILLRELHKIWPPLDSRHMWAVRGRIKPIRHGLRSYLETDERMLEEVEWFLANGGQPVSVTQVVID